MKRSDLFVQRLTQCLPAVSCSVEGSPEKFKVVIENGNIFGAAIVEIFDSELFIHQIQVTPRRQKHGTAFMSAVEFAAKQIGVTKLSCRPVSSPDGANCGMEFFSAIGFRPLEFIYEKPI